ncbi:MAG TPA: SpoIIE family protein phosphatase [Candidatus Angelobacter sp.]
MALRNKITGILARLVPRTRVARLTAYLAGVQLVLLLLEAVSQRTGTAAAAHSLSQWTGFLGFVLTILLVFLALRWFRNRVMWSVRNRLIVTYMFIGVVPLVLVLLIASLSAYLLAGQFSAYLTASEIEAQLQRLQAANSSTAELVAERNGAANATPALAAEDAAFPGRIVQILPEPAWPSWLKDGFRSLVLDQGHIFLRAANIVDSGRRKFAVISSVPVDQKFLSKIAADLGPLAVYVPQEDPKDPNADNHVEIQLGRGTVIVNGKPAVGISAGTLPEPINRWDRELIYNSQMRPVDWKTGEAKTPVWLVGSTRASSLYARLSTSTNKWTDTVALVLTVLAVTLGIIVLIAWLIGIRLTRTVTYSVATLYKATEHINRGDFTHRIKVRHKDQLGALQTAFNSMTESVERLIEAQKEKERLQSELEIAHEVQSQLFPQAGCGTRTLELAGTCRPARIVSGDYYDFLSYNPEQIGIAVGDISGKGISAALLMATIHSAVRAYEQEQVVPAGAASRRYDRDSRTATADSRIVRPSPAHMLWLLNRHIYQTTQPEKYATLFLGFYDDEQRRLTYSNAGHLPPIILGEDGSTRRLDVGGTVVGLFDRMEYQEQTVQLHPGDLFIAFSDGMTEPENEFGEFGEDRLVETIAGYRQQSLERISEHAVAAVQDWIGAEEQPDDVTLVLARRVA